MPDISNETLDEVEGILDEITSGHGVTVASTSGGYGSPIRSSYYAYKCACSRCATLAHLRAEREVK